MNSLPILERSCPWCGHRRTVRLGPPNALFCFNCRLRSDSHRATGTPPAGASVSYPFDPAQWRRLQVYRAAVRAGFYSDRC
jgi:hypothetical protein